MPSSTRHARSIRHSCVFCTASVAPRNNWKIRRSNGLLSSPTEASVFWDTVRQVLLFVEVPGSQVKQDREAALCHRARVRDAQGNARLSSWSKYTSRLCSAPLPALPDTQLADNSARRQVPAKLVARRIMLSHYRSPEMTPVAWKISATENFSSTDRMSD